MKHDIKLDINIGNEHILKHFPNFEYFNCTEPERLNFAKVDNLVGNQQRAFVLYHILREVKRTGGEGGLSLGCGQVIEPFTIGIDHYYGSKHPIYGGGYWPHLTAKCEKLPFNDNVFAFIVGSHIFEHMEKPLEAFKEWIRVLKPEGSLILVFPDANYESIFHPWDSDHKMFWTPEKFQDRILNSCEELIKTEIFNTFKNSFSMNYLGRKM